MTIGEHTEEFAGYPIVNWTQGEELQADPENTLFRISLDYEEAESGLTWTDKFAEFSSLSDARSIPGIVVGLWGEIGGEQAADPVVAALVAARDFFPNFHVIFFGDITFDECEISWIEQTDIAPLFTAYQGLTNFCVRGGNGLRLGNLKHESLVQLVIQAGGLPSTVVEDVCKAHLPALEELELWLGDSNYGGDCTVENLQPILDGKLFPNLRHLGLRNSEITDDIAKAIVNAPILDRLEVLDLSMGTLSNAGGEALLSCQKLRKLELLNLSHHYLSNELMSRFEDSGIPVNLDEQEEGDEDDGEVYRYVSVGE